ncbi:hypothetical protein Gotur_019332 [Gossypium turneri]
MLFNSGRTHNLSISSFRNTPASLYAYLYYSDPGQV